MRNQPPFGFMLPMLMSGEMPGMENQQHPSQMMPDNPVPARVKVAMEFLAMLHRKEMKRGAVADGASQTLELEGVAPTIHEEGSSEAACELLSAYFRGNLRMDQWEELRHDAIRKRIEKEELDSKQAREQDQKGPMAPCPICSGTQGMQCRVCHGAGSVMLISPLKSGKIINPMHSSSRSGFPSGLFEDIVQTVLGGKKEDESEESEDPGNSTDDSEPGL